MLPTLNKSIMIIIKNILKQNPRTKICNEEILYNLMDTSYNACQKSLGTPLQILPCFAISPSPPQNNVVLWSKNRHDRTIRDSAGMLGE